MSESKLTERDLTPRIEQQEVEVSLDANGYPNDSMLEAIENYRSTTVKGWRDLMSSIEGAWAYRDWGWATEGINDGNDAGRIRYRISTAGWSGNESLISALESNKSFFWAQFWETHKRGGHFTFVI